MPVRGTGRRYFTFSIDCEKKVTEQQVVYTILESVRDIFGDYGLSIIQPTIIEYKVENKEGIVRCTRGHERELRAVLALITKISEIEASVRVIGVSGTIKSLKSKTDYG